MNLLKSVFILPLVIALSWTSKSHASSSREFVMSCTYGVLAGTLVGAATLAFEDQPGDKFYKVARGASLGLYAGIALGLYVVYGVSDGSELEDETGLPPEGRFRTPKKFDPGFVVNPMMNDRLQVDGAVAQFRVLQF